MATTTEFPFTLRLGASAIACRTHIITGSWFFFFVAVTGETVLLAGHLSKTTTTTTTTTQLAQ